MAKSKQVGRERNVNRVARAPVNLIPRKTRTRKPGETVTVTPAPESVNPLKALEAKITEHTAGDGSVTVRPAQPEATRQRGRPRSGVTVAVVTPRRGKETVSDERAAEIVAEAHKSRGPISEAEFMAAALKETGWSCAEFARRVCDGSRKDMGKWWDRVIYRTNMLALAPEHQLLIDTGEISEVAGWHLGRIPVEHRAQFLDRLVADKQAETKAFATAKALRALADTLIPAEAQAA